jgi:hypothetical protein
MGRLKGEMPRRRARERPGLHRRLQAGAAGELDLEGRPRRRARVVPDSNVHFPVGQFAIVRVRPERDDGDGDEQHGSADED